MRVLYPGRIGLWNVIFCRERKTGEPGEKPSGQTGEPGEKSSGQGRELTTNSTHIWHRTGIELNTHMAPDRNNWTRATLLGGEGCNQSAIPAPRQGWRSEHTQNTFTPLVSDHISKHYFNQFYPLKTVVWEVESSCTLYCSKAEKVSKFYRRRRSGNTTRSGVLLWFIFSIEKLTMKKKQKSNSRKIHAACN